MQTLQTILQSIAHLPNNEYIISLAGRGEPALHNDYATLLSELIEFKKTQANVKIDISTNGTRFDQYLPYYRYMDSVSFNVYYNYTNQDYVRICNKYKQYSNIRVKRKHQQPIKYFSSRVGTIANDITIHEKDQLLESYCNKPFESVYIDWNGNYNLCCEDWRKDLLVLGSIDSESIFHYYTENILLQEYKQALIQGQRTLSPCDKCNKRCSKKFIEKILQHETQDTHSIS